MGTGTPDNTSDSQSTNVAAGLGGTPAPVQTTTPTLSDAPPANLTPGQTQQYQPQNADAQRFGSISNALNGGSGGKGSLAKAVVAGVLVGMMNGLGAKPGPNHLGEAAKMGMEGVQNMYDKRLQQQRQAKSDAEQEQDRQQINNARALETNLNQLRLQQMTAQMSQEQAQGHIDAQAGIEGDEGPTGLLEKESADFVKNNPGYVAKATGKVLNQNNTYDNTYTMVKPREMNYTDEQGNLTPFAQKVVDYNLPPAKGVASLKGTPNQTTNGAYGATLTLQVSQADALQDAITGIGGGGDIKKSLNDGSLMWSDVRNYANAQGQTPHERISALAANAPTAGSASRLEALFGKDNLNDSQAVSDMQTPGKVKPEDVARIAAYPDDSAYAKMHPKAYAQAKEIVAGEAELKTNDNPESKPADPDDVQSFVKNLGSFKYLDEGTKQDITSQAGRKGISVKDLASLRQRADTAEQSGAHDAATRAAAEANKDEGKMVRVDSGNGYDEAVPLAQARAEGREGETIKDPTKERQTLNQTNTARRALENYKTAMAGLDAEGGVKSSSALREITSDEEGLKLGFGMEGGKINVPTDWLNQLGTDTNYAALTTAEKQAATAYWGYKAAYLSSYMRAQTNQGRGNPEVIHAEANSMPKPWEPEDVRNQKLQNFEDNQRGLEQTVARFHNVDKPEDIMAKGEQSRNDIRNAHKSQVPPAKNKSGQTPAPDKKSGGIINWLSGK